jgi:transcriptional regulator with XRE-family HTH domain
VVDEVEPEHTGEVIRRLRSLAGLTVEDVAEQAGVDPLWLAGLEKGEGVEDLGYDDVLRLVRATQPARPDWWDEGHEHDLHLGPGADHRASTDGDRRYWARIESVREEIRRHYQRGRQAS